MSAQVDIQEGASEWVHATGRSDAAVVRDQRADLALVLSEIIGADAVEKWSPRELRDCLWRRGLPYVSYARVFCAVAEHLVAKRTMPSERTLPRELHGLDTGILHCTTEAEFDWPSRSLEDLRHIMETSLTKKRDHLREHMADLMRYFHDVLAADDEVEFADYLFDPAPFDSTRCSAWILDSKHRSTGPVFHQCRFERCNEVNRFCEQHSKTKTLTYGE